MKNTVVCNCIEDFIKSINDMPEGTIDLKGVVQWAVDTAYRDTQRVLTGIGKNELKKKKAIDGIVSKLVEDFSAKESPWKTKDEFETEHKNLCGIWTKEFSDNPAIGAYGKAQKIINMSFKYLYCVNYKLKNRYEYWFRFCHMTLDSYTLDWIYEKQNKNEKVVKKDTKWSCLDPKQYENIAKIAISAVEGNRMFADCMVIEAEFVIWDASIIYRGTKEYKKLCDKYKGRKYLKIEDSSKYGNINDYIENSIMC